MGMEDSTIKHQSAPTGRNSHSEPTRFGRYFLADKISKGGMSDIYLAKAVSLGGFQKPLVIKKLLPEYAKKHRFVKRFLNEGKTLARLNHSNVVQVIDIGVIDGEYYIAMEYIEGRNAAHVLARAKRTGRYPSLAFALYVVMELAKGLAYAHRKKGTDGQSLMLVHQDLNSFNVMISYEAEVKIIDFGIARILMNGTSGPAEPVAGKLLYFSPEQLLSKPLDRRVDIYGIGVLLYELITGVRLVRHQETVEETVRMILDLNVETTVENNERIPPEVKPILIKAMAADPEDRYPWMEDLMEDVRAIIAKSSLDVNTATFAEYMKDMFQRDILTDRRRMRKLMSAGVPREDLRRSRDRFTSRRAGRKDGPNLADEFTRQSHSIIDREDLDPTEQPHLLPETTNIRAGRTIFQQGDAGSDLYVVQKGKVRTFLRVGQKRQTLSVLGPGDIFGETAILDYPRRAESAEAIEDCDLMVIPAETFSHFITEGLTRKLVVRLVEKLRDTNGLLESTLFADPLSRLIHGMVFLHRRGSLGNGDDIDFDELGDLFGLEDADQIQKYLEKLVTLQVLEIEADSVKLKDSDKLTNILRILTTSGKLTLKF
jgi:serine/threonine protein kinase